MAKHFAKRFLVLDVPELSQFQRENQNTYNRNYLYLVRLVINAVD